MDRQLQGLTSAIVATLPLAMIVAGTLQLARADEMKVNWNDPEIQKFAKEHATNRPQSLEIAQVDRISRLKLPVLAFDSTPQLVKNAAPQGLAPTVPSHQILMNEADPTWYQINDEYGDIAISVQASLTVHHDVPKSTIYQPPPGLAVQNEPQIAVFDENGEPDFKGLIIEYTVYKYPDIPYIVTIECSEQSKEKCRDLAVITKDKDLLKLISAQPPR
jgi:hypothetical protein